LGEGPGMGPYVLIGGFYVYPLNQLLSFHKEVVVRTTKAHQAQDRRNKTGQQFMFVPAELVTPHIMAKPVKVGQHSFGKAFSMGNPFHEFI